MTQPSHTQAIEDCISKLGIPFDIQNGYVRIRKTPEIYKKVSDALYEGNISCIQTSWANYLRIYPV